MEVTFYAQRTTALPHLLSGDCSPMSILFNFAIYSNITIELMFAGVNMFLARLRLILLYYYYNNFRGNFTKGIIDSAVILNAVGVATAFIMRIVFLSQKHSLSHKLKSSAEHAKCEVFKLSKTTEVRK